MRTTRSLLALPAVVFCALASPGTVAQQACTAAGRVEFTCGPQNAEDLVLVPGTDWIVASGMAAGAGFYLINSDSREWSALPTAVRHDSAMFPQCSAPPTAGEFESHGLNLRAGTGPRSTLYVVGHGAREAIEVFDVDASGARPTLTWKGCVPLPEGLAANSVASFADGGMVATILMMPGKTFADSVAMRPTGAVVKWSPGEAGFTVLGGSELPGNNGIETSADGREIYVVSSGFQTIVAFSNTNPLRQLRTTVQLPITPDNVHMGPDGRLLTAGMKNDEPACGGPPGPQHDIEKLSQCPRSSIGLAIDPATMKDSPVAETPADPKFSNATMVLTLDGQFWFGTFSGDRVAHGRLR
jgi:hypothetical protein